MLPTRNPNTGADRKAKKANAPNTSPLKVWDIPRRAACLIYKKNLYIYLICIWRLHVFFHTPARTSFYVKYTFWFYVTFSTSGSIATFGTSLRSGDTIFWTCNMPILSLWRIKMSLDLKRYGFLRRLHVSPARHHQVTWRTESFPVYMRVRVLPLYWKTLSYLSHLMMPPGRNVVDEKNLIFASQGTFSFFEVANA